MAEHHHVNSTMALRARSSLSLNTFCSRDDNSTTSVRRSDQQMDTLAFLGGWDCLDFFNCLLGVFPLKCYLGAFVTSSNILQSLWL